MAEHDSSQAHVDDTSSTSNQNTTAKKNNFHSAFAFTTCSTTLFLPLMKKLSKQQPPSKLAILIFGIV
ncbi:hypothetical protein A2U01_0083013 [Trifolium medium]|uniref:Uncharacterized protein n=1 Tax=Trifolium medium TaxID=97028 RepID=A0A392TNN6_9FABA|nr:hypothetical protein [Trifolium medium]